ncbi:MAG: tRNA 2-thiocytidine biosynthesis TtcA family protein [Desulfohalobiaceae bacterium]|nr:tRNA 2-thiocytidine biosynthesis TtcA family protein [Desulfohalobiaceae bacterium]
MMYRTGMLWPGARVGIAVSGGVDSFLLLQLMLLHRIRLPFRVELMAIHVNPGFEPNNHLPLRHWLQQNGVAGHLEVCDMGPRAHSSENRKNSPCFFCSWRRRKRLFQLVKHYRLSHIALGHNADDLAENFFLNLAYAGRVEGMFGKETFFGGEFQLIRPLLLLQKREIRKAVREWDLPVWSNPCPSKNATKREEIGRWVEEISGGDKRIRKNIYSALTRWQMEQDSQS